MCFCRGKVNVKRKLVSHSEGFMIGAENVLIKMLLFLYLQRYINLTSSSCRLEMVSLGHLAIFWVSFSYFHLNIYGLSPSP